MSSNSEICINHCSVDMNSSMQHHTMAANPGFSLKEQHKTKETTTGRWTHDEHQLFLEGLKLYKKQWKQIADLIKTRTVVQIRTHAQKYFQKLMKMNKTDEYDESFLQEFVVNNQNTPYGVNNLKTISFDESEDLSIVTNDKKVKRVRSDSWNAAPRSKKSKTLSMNYMKPSSPKSVSEPTGGTGHHFFPINQFGINPIEDESCKNDFDFGVDDWLPDTANQGFQVFFDYSSFIHPMIQPTYHPNFYGLSGYVQHEVFPVPCYDHRMLNAYNTYPVCDNTNKYDDELAFWLAETTEDNKTTNPVVASSENNPSKCETFEDVCQPTTSEPRRDVLYNMDVLKLDQSRKGDDLINQSTKTNSSSLDVTLSTESVKCEIIVPEITPVPLVRKRGRPRRALCAEDAQTVEVFDMKPFPPSICTNVHTVPYLDSVNVVWDDDEVIGGLLDPFA